MELTIAKIGDPVLRQPAREVPEKEIVSEKVQKFIDDLIETKRAAKGAGLAAPQVSVLWKIFVAEVDGSTRYSYKPPIPLTVLINPKITFLTEERFENFEGCLSVPDLRGVVERCPEIRVEGLDREGKPIDQVMKGITAGTFQHENDHLNGTIFVDRVKDSKTFCTWEEFKKHHENEFHRQVKIIVAKYGS
ncbi:MAG: peptide deformylase [SAR324 cluster bacterium]|nr:peptide deformylase [SAR324 cluster bacterium]